MVAEAAASAGGEELRTPGSCWELFTTFTIITMQAFGGALAHIERAMVQKKRWLTPQEFLGLFAIAQVLPGPSGMGFCVLLGDRYFGLRGAISALAGFTVVPAFVVLGLATLFLHYQQLAWVQGALHGMGAASVGLVIFTAWRMSKGLHGDTSALVIGAATFAAVALLRVPISMVMLSLGVGSIAWAWHVLGRR